MKDMSNLIEDRLSALRKKLASRKGKIPYRDNTPLIEKEIERLEQILEARNSENDDGK